MFSWIHHLLNPHCEQCAREKLCVNCDTLRDLLEAERREKKHLLDMLLTKDVKPLEVPVAEYEEPKPIATGHRAWGVVKRELEAQDRKQAQILKDTEIEELEKKAGIANAN